MTSSRILELLAMNILRHEDAMEALMVDLSALNDAVTRIEGMVSDLKAREANAAAQSEAVAAAAVAAADAAVQDAINATVDRLNAIGG